MARAFMLGISQNIVDDFMFQITKDELKQS
jgi:hypothetical protein